MRSACIFLILLGIEGSRWCIPSVPGIPGIPGVLPAVVFADLVALVGGFRRGV
jgi:hypothetical protein